MKKPEIIKKAEILFSKLMLAAQTGTLVYEVLEKGQAVTVDGETAPDGEYKVTVDEVEKDVVVKDGMIDSITETETETETEIETETEVEAVANIVIDGDYVMMIDGVEKTVTFKDGVPTDAKLIELSDEEKEEAEIKLASMEKEKILNIPNLLALFSDKKNGSGSIYFDFKDGVLQWGDIYTEEYKTLLSSDIEAKDTKIKDLELSIEKKEASILKLTLSNEELIKGPVETPVDDSKMTRSERLIAKFKD